jgi:hypothetical protein
MKKIISIVLILGFLFIDFLFFHDMFKPGESITLPQYLTGILSLVVIALALRSLLMPSDKNLDQAQASSRGHK